MAWATQQPGWEIADHDYELAVYVRNVGTMQAILMDPEFHTLMAEDAGYTLHNKAKVTAGWEEVFVEDGKIVEPDAKATFEERTSIGS